MTIIDYGLTETQSSTKEIYFSPSAKERVSSEQIRSELAIALWTDVQFSKSILSEDKLMLLTIELDREDDGRIIADIEAIPGVMLYANTREEAIKNIKVMALEVLADFLKHGDIENVEGVKFIEP
jgi:predicted RNase H-like HicB family nuclease